MSRRYHCDYCDKTFIDDLEARKKHLQSSHHVKLRNSHYERYRDPKTILVEESRKEVCRRFRQTGTCQFSGNCKYTHYTPEQLLELKYQIDCAEYQKQHSAAQEQKLPSLELWLEKYYEKHSKDKEDLDEIKLGWTYPEHLELRTDLPPSLKKIKPEDFVNGEFEEWG